MHVNKKIALLFLLAACVSYVYISFVRETTIPQMYEEAQEFGAVQTIEYMGNVSVSPISPIGDEQAISRAMTAKMLVSIFKSTAEIHAMEMVHPFSDVGPDSWYAAYVNAAYSLGIMRGNGERFMPDAALSIGQAQILLRILDSGINFVEPSDPNRPISYALWVELYKQLLESLSGSRAIYEAFGISALDIIVLATAANSPLPTGHLVSDRGHFGHQGLTLDAYIDRQLRVLVRHREIIALSSLLSERPNLKSAYIVDVKDHGLTVFAGGAERFFYHENVDSIQSGTIADIVVQDGRALSVQPLSESVKGTLLRLSYGLLELKEVGTFPLAPDFKIYDIHEGPVRWRTHADLIVGTNSARFYKGEGGSIAAAVITASDFPENIRVVIGTSNFDALIHSSISLSSSGNFWITGGGADSERLAELSPGQRFTVSDIENTDLLGHPRLFFHTEPGETLQLTGLQRHWPQNAAPRYRGIIEIAREANGYSIVNVLCLEEYLYAVVPSEMPSSYGVEASKVQAITARSFAVHQILANRFHALGGNIDDSVMSQVYNNVPENALSIEAVRATEGLVLWYGEQIIQANFFSTSAGMSANSGEVWATALSNFPGNTPTFLQAQPQFPSSSESIHSALRAGLSSEEQAAHFFRDQDIASEAYDGHSPWFRWQLEMSAAELAASINKQLESGHSLNPNLIRVYGEDGQWHSRPVSSVGNLRDILVLSRGEGGNIMELRISGDEAEIKIATELNIRKLLRPARTSSGDRDIVIRRADGSALLNQAMLPSAFFSFDKIFDEDGNLEGLAFFGGGHGHGVGMSQNGVRGMVERGYSYEEVLGHFYPGTFLAAYHTIFY